jgi:uncharacterized protein (DUF1330 family)
MYYYFIVTIKITNESTYDKSLEACDGLFEKYNGKYLAVNEDAKASEGNLDGDRVVIIRFDTKEDFESWYYSKEYREILKYRLEGAECRGILVKGV